MRVFVLGSAQDAGIPQADCWCRRCRAAARDPRKHRLPACVAVEDARGARFLVDATPSFPDQAIRLRKPAGGRKSSGRSLPFAGILLTHAHMGHYTGLVHLGREAAHTRRFPVWATPAMHRFLAANRPFKHLVDRGEIARRTVAPGRAVRLSATLRATAVSVPHRNEDADTVCFLFEEGRRGTRKNFLYLPDADYFPDKIVRLIRDVDLALVDGTFYTHDEVRGALRRDARRIPHPPIAETSPLLAGARGRVLYTHLNHTNRLLSQAGLVKRLVHLGLGVARDGQILIL